MERTEKTSPIIEKLQGLNHAHLEMSLLLMSIIRDIDGRQEEPIEDEQKPASLDELVNVLVSRSDKILKLANDIRFKIFG